MQNCGFLPRAIIYSRNRFLEDTVLAQDRRSSSAGHAPRPEDRQRHRRDEAGDPGNRAGDSGAQFCLSGRDGTGRYGERGIPRTGEIGISLNQTTGHSYTAIVAAVGGRFIGPAAGLDQSSPYELGAAGLSLPRGLICATPVWFDLACLQHRTLVVSVCYLFRLFVTVSWFESRGPWDRTRGSRGPFFGGYSGNEVVCWQSFF